MHRNRLIDRLAASAAGITLLLATASAQAIELVSSPALAGLTRLGAAASVAPRPFTVRNVYAKAGATRNTDVEVGRLILFGDSYTDLAFSVGYSNWAEQLERSGFVGELESYAIAGGKARPEAGPKPLSVQIDNFLATSPTFAGNDLTAVFLGFNDVGFNTDMATSNAAFTAQTQRLLTAGTTKNDRRLFLVNLFDNTRAPGNNPPGTFPSFSPERVDVTRWNRNLEAFANTRNRIVVVDLFTAFEKVFANPERYGLTNITTPDLVASKTTALWRDEIHFGARGHQLISQVFRHYLTRAWDWSNTLDAGAEARARLKKDIEAGLVLRLDQQQPDESALRLFPIGDAAYAAAGAFDETATVDPRTGRDGFGDGGLGLDMALGPDTSLGLVYGVYDETVDGDSELSSEVDARSLAVYLRRHWAGLDWRTLVAHSEDRYDSEIHAGFGTATGDGDTNGRSTTLSQRAEKRLETGLGLVAPWVELTHSIQQVDGYTVSHPLVSDTTYSGVRVQDTVLGLGISAIAWPMALSPDSSLTLRGGLAYEIDLARDDYELTISEANGSRNRETIERPERNTLVLSLGAALAVGDDAALDLGYEVADQTGSDPEHALRLAFTWRF